MSEEKSTQFERRFQSVVSKMRFTRVFSVLGWITFMLYLVLAILACMDYLFEFDWNSRATVVFAASTLAVGAGVWLMTRSLQRWNRRRTAAQVEKRFSDLGQSVRTSVQFRDEDASASGVSPSLLQALNSDVASRTGDLRLTEAVPTATLKAAVALMSLLLLATFVACWTSWDWRMATSRVLLGNAPYTTVRVSEGDSRVEEKATFTLKTDIAGRTARNVRLLTRELDSEQAEWNERPFTTKDAIAQETRLVSYSVDIPKVKKPFEYQVVAGKYASPVHRVDVQYPLAITKFQIELTPPAYTGVATKSIDRGSFEAVEGSTVMMGFQLDHAPSKAWLELRPIVTPLGEDPQIERVDLNVDGRRLSASLDLVRDRFYQVKAEAEDGTKLRPNRFRIRVHEDRVPKVGFRSPEQLIEVHPLAELVMKLKVSDDYGLRRAGIVFQKNNEVEVVLEDIAYEDITTDDGRLSPQTRDMIESAFPLEYFELSIKDSISYYGFAEDNRPGNPNTNETDLHFIDVRPYRREFPVPPENQGLNGMGNNNPNSRNLPELNEMIGRERFVLNRTMQMKRHDARGRSIDANTIDRLINVQNETSELAGLMGDEATRIEIQFGIPEEGRISDLLYQAQSSMLTSVDSLTTNEFELAKLQEKDALQYLIDARQRLDSPPNGSRAGGAAFRAAFRRLMRRRRQPRNNRERAREVVRRLRRAAAEQEFLMEKMSDLVAPEMPEREQPESDEAMNDEIPDEQQDEAEQNSPVEEMTEDEAEREAELRRELEEEQAVLSDDILDIVDLMEQLTQLTSLAEQRTARASSSISGIIGALERRNTASAMSMAHSTSADLRILAENIEGITADEATKRLEVARDLGLLLTDEIHELEDGLTSAETELAQEDMEGSEMAEREQELADPLSRRAQEQAEIARTIEDILNSILDPEMGIQDEEDRMVKRLREIMDENKFAQSVGRIQELPAAIDALDWANAAVQSDDLADRFDVVSQRLDAMHREILSPRIEQLRRLEQRAVRVRQQMSEAQTQDQADRWESRTQGLLEDIESAQVAESQVASLRESMESAGQNGSSSWSVGGDGALQAPAEYAEGLGFVISEIQRHIRELSTVDGEVTNTGAIPVKYRQFVDRYLEVLSGATGTGMESNSAN